MRIPKAYSERTQKAGALLLRMCAILLSIFCMVWLGGCIQSPVQLDLCKLGDLSQAELDAVRTRIAEVEASRDEVLKDCREPFQGMIENSLELSYLLRWIPLFWNESKHTIVYRGKVPYVEQVFYNPDNFSPPWHIRSVRPDEQWIYACNFRSIGPAALLYWRDEEAAFDMKGRNFHYDQTKTVAWGLLWTDRCKARSREFQRPDHYAGVFFTAFGYGQETMAQEVVTTLRFLWIPIPIARKPVEQNVTSETANG